MLIGDMYESFELDEGNKIQYKRTRYYLTRHQISSEITIIIDIYNPYIPPKRES